MCLLIGLNTPKIQLSLDKMQQERYYQYIKRRNREEDAIMGLDNAKRSIWVTFTKEGIHKYPAALDDPALATGDEYDVSFLGYPHRHTFHFKVQIQVTHNDRAVSYTHLRAHET